MIGDHSLGFAIERVIFSPGLPLPFATTVSPSFATSVTVPRSPEQCAVTSSVFLSMSGTITRDSIWFLLTGSSQTVNHIPLVQVNSECIFLAQFRMTCLPNG